MENTPDETIQWIKDNLTQDTPLRLMYQQNKNELFVIWAEALEQKINNNSLIIDINKIGRYIRRELLEIDLEKAVVYMYEALPAKFKHVSDEHVDEDELISKNVGNPTKSSSIDPSLTNETILQIANDLKNTTTNLINYLQNTTITEIKKIND